MANSFLVPFNHAPASTDYGNAARSFTCSSGTYARVVVSLLANTYGSFDDRNGNSNTVNSASDSSASDKTAEFWLVAGDVFAVSVVTASNTGTGTSVSTRFLKTGVSSATATINSNIVAFCSSSVNLQWFSAAGVANYGWNINGITDAKFHVEIYNVIA